MKLAIVIGVSEYKFDTYNNLPACKNDAELFNQVLSNVKSIDDALYVNETLSAFDVKQRLRAFVEKHKDEDIEELVFYFSGHGDRFDEDFHYLCYDFEKAKKSTTSITNSYLDSLIRNLSPNLCVKIVDACYSGTHYIKNSVSESAVLESSAKKSKINDLYFLFSSREDKESEAGDEFSYFTESIFSSLLEREGEYKYSDIISYVADDLENRGAPKPIFISQATYLENFGEVTKSTHDIIHAKFGLIDDEVPTTKKSQIESTFFSLVKNSSDLHFCDKETAIENLDVLSNIFKEPSNWSTDITSVFEIVHSKSYSSSLPNKQSIGEWIDNNKELKLFCKADFEDYEYEVQEYVEVPSKPSNSPFSRSSRGLFESSVQRLLASHDVFREKEYNLETVKRTKKVIVGFEYSYHDEYDMNIQKLELKPLFDAAENAVLYVVLLYSKSKLSVHYSYEILKCTHWDVISSPKCSNWKNKVIALNNKDGITTFSKGVIDEVSTWLIDETKKNLKDL
ncbi:hypothetical protein ACS88_12920 [Vibrio parahaemolyticus]|nr:hypothetical protein ACS88_12920 [Vibrio parahaemolyticus]